MKTFNKLVLALALAATITACSASGAGVVDSNSKTLTERTITLQDGRTITCVTYWDAKGAGLSCDW